MTVRYKFDGVLLAGGLSSRMGKDKSLLCCDGVSLLKRQKRLLERAGAVNIYISRNDNSPDTLADIYPHKGPLSGVHSALRVSKNDLICVPVDMPLLDENMLMELVNIGLKTAMIAHYQNQVLPVFIPNTFNSNQYLERVLSGNANTSLKHFLSHIGCVQIKTKNPKHLINVNTPKQWEQAVKSINNSYQF